MDNKHIDIYFISNGRNIKIGQTSDLIMRQRVLQTGNDTPLKVLYAIKDVPSELESLLHKMGAAYNVQGEWFTPEVIPHIQKHPWYKENMKPPETN